MTLDSFNAFTVTVTPQRVLWKYNYNINDHQNVDFEDRKRFFWLLEKQICLKIYRLPPT